MQGIPAVDGSAAVVGEAEREGGHGRHGIEEWFGASESGKITRSMCVGGKRRMRRPTSRHCVPALGQ